MERIEAYKFRDQIFMTERDCQNHIDSIIGNLVCKLASDMVHIDKYTLMLDYIMNNIDSFVEIKNLQSEFILE